MTKKEGYEVIRFIEKGEYCHASLDYVEGVTLYDWITQHKKIDKKILEIWLKEILHQLDMFHMQKNSSDYGYLNPYQIVIYHKNKIALLAARESDSSRTFEKYFIPTNNRCNVDVFCFGKIIQFILAHVQCVPNLTKLEEVRIQRVIRKCLGSNQKSMYSDIHTVLDRFSGNKEYKVNWKVVTIVVVFLVVGGIFGIVKGATNSKAHPVDEIQELEDMEKGEANDPLGVPENDLIGEEYPDLLLQAGIDYFMEAEDYEKALSYIEKSNANDKKREYYLALAKFMMGDKSATDQEELKAKLPMELVEEMILNVKELIAFTRAYAYFESSDYYGKILELIESEQMSVQKQGLSTKLWTEFEEYRASIYEQNGNWKCAMDHYFMLREINQKTEEKLQWYSSKIMDSMMKYLEGVWGDVNRTEDDKIEEMKQLMAKKPEMIQEDVFKKFAEEKKIHIEEGKVWIGEAENPLEREDAG